MQTKDRDRSQGAVPFLHPPSHPQTPDLGSDRPVALALGRKMAWVCASALILLVELEGDVPGSK